ncbi:Branched-chain alpha-keto acid dehydrogenase, E1 component, alpha subunit [hydrothermal vent metagenome]|uniref:Branched-chain alpha-keto acid dehydrogenase, E1 component, alpha subunit n=1 Tax=hydrothermal vent metagenome TaxID=652676 RepID=A0A3B0XAU1_9ZZZZ
MKEIASFSIHYSQLLNNQGRLQATPGPFTSNTENLLKLYRNMLTSRLFDSKAIALQRTGRLGTYASTLGQEALPTAAGYAMAREDVLAPMYREYAALFVRGVSISEILLYWGGDERGMAFQNGSDDLPFCVPIASQTCHAVGVAYAFKLRKQPRVAVCVIGDGGTSKGDFYEAINAAGVWQLPVVFLVHNNQWAISVPRAQQSAAKTLAQKAVAAGISCEQIDGNDVLGCYEKISAAVERARTGGGPHLIEAMSYRLGNHTTADDASRYRSEKEVEEAWKNEPIQRLKLHLLQDKKVSEDSLNEMKEQCQQQIDEQVEIYLNTPRQPLESMFDSLYEQLPQSLQQQRAECMKKVAK